MSGEGSTPVDSGAFSGRIANTPFDAGDELAPVVVTEHLEAAADVGAILEDAARAAPEAAAVAVVDAGSEAAAHDAAPFDAGCDALCSWGECVAAYLRACQSNPSGCSLPVTQVCGQP
jgi:hypothetical protein